MSDSNNSLSRLLQVLLGISLLLFLLTVTRAILLPLAIAVLLLILVNALTHEISRLQIQGKNIPYFIANSFALILILSSVALTGYILAIQIKEIALKAPYYADRSHNIAQHINDFLGSDISAGFKDYLKTIDIRGRISAAVTMTADSVLTLGLILLYLGFLLTSQRYFPAKLKAIFPTSQKAAEFEALALSISAHVRRYMWIKTLTSSLTGISTFAVVKIMGVDFAATWGFLAFLLNFIPNIGSPLAVFFPALLALVQFDTFLPFLIVMVSLGIIQLFIDNILEPIFLGRSLNISSFVIIFSLAFWGVVWGVAGMFLAVPIMVITAIICAHIQSWQWLAIIISEKGDVSDFFDENKLGV